MSAGVNAMSPDRTHIFRAVDRLVAKGLTVDQAAVDWEAETKPTLMAGLYHDLRVDLGGTVRIIEQHLGLYGRCTCRQDTGCYQSAGNDGLCGYCHRWHREAESDRGHLSDGQAA